VGTLAFVAPALTSGRRETMLWTIAITFTVLWALGLVSTLTFGGYVHVLLGVAVVLVLIRLIKGRGPGRRASG
jgi:Flp pilus assembly protein TadB